MTSRIQEDGGATEGKWADIEDDEDDWAPETIEWTDGTKTNLAEPPPPTPQEALKPMPQPEQPVDQDMKPSEERKQPPADGTTFDCQGDRKVCPEAYDIYWTERYCAQTGSKF